MGKKYENSKSLKRTARKKGQNTKKKQKVPRSKKRRTSHKKTKKKLEDIKNKKGNKIIQH